MKKRTKSITQLDLVMAVSDAVDLIDPILADHHKRVAYAAIALVGEMAHPRKKWGQLAFAALLHDIGALSRKERIELERFTTDEINDHAELGFRLLKNYKPLSQAADIVRFHHQHWDSGRGIEADGQSVPFEAHILHLADRVYSLIDKSREVLSQVNGICKTVQEQSGVMFHPDIMAAFLTISEKEFFWIELTTPGIDAILRNNLETADIELSMDDIMEISRMFSRIIDFRSRFTSTHSSGVAAVAEGMARLAGMSAENVQKMRIAGYLHDLGKLSVSPEILNKPAALDESERNIMRKHSYYTYRILNKIPAMAEINSWAALHHEQFQGDGYPFHLKEHQLSTGSRIMAVCDIFTAVTEDRPYRKGMSESVIKKLFHAYVQSKTLDSHLVDLLMDNFDHFNNVRIDAQEESQREYMLFSNNN